MYAEPCLSHASPPKLAPANGIGLATSLADAEIVAARGNCLTLGVSRLWVADIAGLCGHMRQ